MLIKRQFFYFGFLVSILGIKTDSVKISNTFEWIDSAPDAEFENFQIEEMIGFMDQDEKPCDNFYGFACGNAKNHPRLESSGIANYFDLMITEFQEYEKIQISSAVEENDSDAEVKTKNFYASCMDLDTINERKNNSAAESLSTLAEWPVLTKHWSDEEFDWVEVVANVTFLQSNIIFGFDFDIKDEKYVLTLKPITSEQAVNADAETSFSEYLDDFTQVKLFSEKIQNIVTLTESVSSENSVLVTLVELEDKFPSLKLNKLISALMEYTLPDDFQIALENEAYYRKLNDLLAETDTRTIANYIFLVLQKSINHETEKTSNRHNYCMLLVKRLMGKGVALVTQKKFNNENTEVEVIELVKKIRAALLKRIENNGWLGVLKSGAIAQFKQVEYDLGLIDDNTFEAANTEYAELSIDPKKYIENMFQLLRIHLREALAYLSMDGKNVIRKLMSIKNEPTCSSMHLPLSDGIVINSPCAMNLPYFNLRSPRFMNYGSFGFWIGHDTLYGFNPNEISLKSLGHPSVLYSTQLYNQIVDRTICYVNQYQKINPIYIGRNLDFQEIFADIDGVTIAYEAYRDWLAENPNEIEDESRWASRLNMTIDQAFFLSFAQTNCMAKEKFIGSTLMRDNHTTDEQRIITPLMSYPKFAEHFNCPIDSPMNPKEKCSFL